MPDRDDKTPSAAGADDPAFLERAGLYLDDELAGPGLEELRRELEADAAKRRAFVLICTGEAIACEELATAGPVQAGGGADLADADVVAEEAPSLHDAMMLPAIEADPEPPVPLPLPAPAPPPAPNRRLATRWRLWAAGAAAAVALALGAGLLGRSGAPPAVATVIESAAARSEGGAALARGGTLGQGKAVVLTEGDVKLLMAGGAEVVVEGPARFTPESGGALNLTQGRVSVRLAGAATGFTVKTASATVEDLGTEFGVAYDAATRDTDVHVFKGRVRLAARGNALVPAVQVAAGDAARTTGGTIVTDPGGASPQSFVRDLTAAVTPLLLADLISGGDGTTGALGGVIDPSNGSANKASGGSAGAPHLTADLTGDGAYHRVPTLAVFDGCFMPDAAPARVDSAGHAFAFPGATGKGTTRVCCGGNGHKLGPLENGTRILTRLAATDYSSPGHTWVFLHPDAGITIDLSVLRRLHPAARPGRFRCTAGNSMPPESGGMADLFVLVDGRERFSRQRFHSSDGPFEVDVPLGESDRFLTVASTGAGDGVGSDQVLLGDPCFDAPGAGRASDAGKSE